MSSIPQNEVKQPQESSNEQQGNAQAAIARTLARGIALYFSRPVRLFRPSKINGWQSLRGLAAQHGTSVTPQYVLSLVRKQGFIVIPKHFIPPMLINAFLGTVLWTTYAEAQHAIGPYLSRNPTLTAALAGSLAGGTQALVAAPAENVRLVIEGGTGGSSWFHAWKEVFQGTRSPSVSRQKDIEDIRRLRSWMKEVGDMAGRGWNGWGWGLGKDMCGFAAFFSVFEVTRRVALEAKAISPNLSVSEERGPLSQFKFPRRFVHDVILLAGGVIAGLTYELVCRPWDVARRAVQLDRVANPSSANSTVMIILRKIHEEGIPSFFHHTHPSPHTLHNSATRRRMYSILRIIGRVGPWGVGFLVWEAYTVEHSQHS